MEIVTYLDEEKKRYIINCVNTMSGGYEAIARDVEITLKTDKLITKAYNITENKQLSVSEDGGEVTVTVGDVDNYAMIILEY